jgi:hypothetical protein
MKQELKTIQNDDDWELESIQAMQVPAQNEFKATVRRLRRKAGLDLNWWENIVYKVCQWLKIRITFK